MTPEQILHDMEQHAAWLLGKGGEQIDWSGADLTGANLAGAIMCDATMTGANLTGADLTGANLTGAIMCDATMTGANLTGAILWDAIMSGANMSGATGIYWVGCGWADHGERGRMLLAVWHGAAEGWMYHCGCFRGDAAGLRKYIKAGDENLKKSRMAAYRFCQARIEEMTERHNLRMEGE